MSGSGKKDQGSAPLADPRREELAQLVGRMLAREWLRRRRSGSLDVPAREGTQEESIR
ncbi:MAG TPA: hypothetical protein PLP01_06685 [Phycisphaerae bacterium]|nr:hypothetical protein [Phycisphaerae bacterium]